MSHDKFIKRGKSLYIDNWNPSAKKFINTCSVCGAQGYAPGIDEDGFVFNNAGKTHNFEHKAIHEELKRIFKPLAVDSLGRCSDCARRMDKD